MSTFRHQARLTFMSLARDVVGRTRLSGIVYRACDGRAVLEDGVVRLNCLSPGLLRWLCEVDWGARRRMRGSEREEGGLRARWNWRRCGERRWWFCRHSEADGRSRSEAVRLRRGRWGGGRWDEGERDGVRVSRESFRDGERRCDRRARRPGLAVERRVLAVPVAARARAREKSRNLPSYILRLIFFSVLVLPAPPSPDPGRGCGSRLSRAR